MNNIIHRLMWIVKNASNLLHGYNIYVNKDKLRLIDSAFRLLGPSAKSFADLGGVWKVNAGYTRYTLKKYKIDRAVIVDTDYPDVIRKKLSSFHQLKVLQGDFTSEKQYEKVNPVDMVFFFDVLLHQANPNWDKVITDYAAITKCFVIFNQQYIKGKESIRLTELPLEKYIEIAPSGREEIYRHVYSHKNEIHPVHGKPWEDIHNIFQWGITDNDLRSVMKKLGFNEVFYFNYGRFSNLPAFENHGFIFIKNNEAGK